MIQEPKQLLAILDLDHPGANDPLYRKRRQEIADAAKEYRLDTDSIPVISYTNEENNTWQSVNILLNQLHPSRACSMYLNARKQLPIDSIRVPQMKELSTTLHNIHGFTLGPIEGLVDSRTFLSQLAEKRMLCTQYIRHHSRPTFTPEPDAIHEFIGHVPMFTNKDVVTFSQLIGEGAKRANEQQLVELERLYWFTLEYGLIEEQGKPKAFGAGLLGGIEDMDNAFKPNADIRKFDLTEIINTDYNYSFLQQRYFIIPSFEFLREETRKLIDKIC